AFAVEHDEELLLRGMDVLRPVALTRLDPVDVQPGLGRSGVAGQPRAGDSEVAAGAPVLPLDLFGVHDVGRPRLGLADLRLPGRDLARPGVVAGSRVRPRGEDPG